MKTIQICLTDPCANWDLDLADQLGRKGVPRGLLDIDIDLETAQVGIVPRLDHAVLLTLDQLDIYGVEPDLIGKVKAEKKMGYVNSLTVRIKDGT